MKTLIDLLEESEKKYDSDPYILEKQSNRYEALSYREVKVQVYKVTAGFMALRLKKGNHE